ncbi:MAG TPA: hypothetical protein VGD42_17970 [Lysobacter sp.]
MILGIAIGLVLLGPLALALAGVVSSRRHGATAATAAPWNWTLVAVSALLYTLAFNLTFFIQELFLVLPKALTPGLHPTLYHNNHRWLGEHALASLFQGTGALATALVGLACAIVARRVRPHSPSRRLFAVWMAYCGLLMALPQVAIGALSSASDLGMAMTYLHWGTSAKTLAALLALGAIPLVALWLLRPALEIAERADDIATPRARARFVLQAVVVPMLIGTALVIPFRVPREMIEVALLPLIVGLPGVLWMLAGAWRVRDARAIGQPMVSFVLPLLAAIALLLVFQLLLRPGIAFY